MPKVQKVPKTSTASNIHIIPDVSIDNEDDVFQEMMNAKSKITRYTTKLCHKIMSRNMSQNSKLCQKFEIMSQNSKLCHKICH